MKDFFTISILIVFQCLSIFAQDDIESKIIVNNEIKIIEAYIFNNREYKDSSLITKEYFNSLGKKEKKEIYEENHLRNYYEYYYDKDTVVNLRKSFDHNSQLKTISRLSIYNKNHKSIWEDFDSLNNPTGIVQKTIYNKNNKPQRISIQKNNFKIYDQIVKYYKNGMVKEEKILEPKEEKCLMFYDENGQMRPNHKARFFLLKTIIKKYENNKPEIIKKSYKFQKTTRIIALEGKRQIYKNDILDIFQYFDTNGLLKNEVQYINGKFTIEKRYKYHF